MTAFEAGGLCGIAGGAIAGGVLAKSYGVLAIIGGVVGGSVVGLFTGVLFGAFVLLICALWYFVTGRVNPDGSIKESIDDGR